MLSAEPLSAPVNVTWEITGRCNLVCRHCLSADLRLNVGRELSLDESTRVVDELAAADVFQINFGGGEPFLRDDFLSILAYAQAQGITTCVSTNGTTLTAEIVDRLLRMRHLFLQVSLDGASAMTNDAIRGRGTFARILEGVRRLSAAGLPDLSLNMVVTKVNADEIGEFVALCTGLGCKPRLSRFRPSGSARGAWDELRLTPRQLRDLSGFLGEHPDILTGDSFFALTSASRRRLGLSRCGAARMTMSIAPDGGVYPCAFLSDTEFLAGNVLESSPIAIFRESSVFERLRETDVAACRECARFAACHGGCPAVAYFVGRSIGVPDPECLHAAMAGDV